MYRKDLRKLYKDCRSELKRRGQLRFLQDYKNEALTPINNTLSQQEIVQAKSRNIIIKSRNNENAGIYDPPKKWHMQNSILVDFLNEDWSFLFKSYDDDKRDYYVYYHLNPNTERLNVTKALNGNFTLIKFAGTPFYIGKGKDGRYKEISNRASSHVNLIKTYLKIGYTKNDICKILIDNLTEREAMELESKLITYFGCYNECLAIEKKHFNGTKGGMLINADIGKRPYWVQSVLNEQFGIIKYVQ